MAKKPNLVSNTGRAALPQGEDKEGFLLPAEDKSWSKNTVSVGVGQIQIKSKSKPKRLDLRKFEVNEEIGDEATVFPVQRISISMKD